MSVNQDQVMRDTWKQFVDVMKLHTLDPETLSFLKSVFFGGYVAGHVEASEAAMKNINAAMANITRGVEQVGNEATEHVIEQIRHDIVMGKLRPH